VPYKDPDAQREYMRLWIKRRRDEWFAKNGPCNKCGTIENLQLDHIDPKTKKHHAVWSWSEKRRNKELRKCQVLCKKCHLSKTKVDGSYFKKTHRGEKNGNSKLKIRDILMIRKRIKSGEKLITIAKIYGVTGETIRVIKTGDSWAWLK